MAIVDLVMPKLGESIMEATILRWHKKVGDPIDMDETLLEIATDKVDSEVPSSVQGTIDALLYEENDVVPIGAVIARINTNGILPAEEIIPQPVQEEPAAPVAEVPYQPLEIKLPKLEGAARFYSPLVLNIAANEGISLAELEKIPGTGNEGRVTKKDILQWIQSGGKQEPAIPEGKAPATETRLQPAAVDVKEEIPEQIPEYGDNVEVVEMDRMRKLIAKHMVDSKKTSAHVTSFAECDVTNIVLWREKIKKAFEQQEGEKITFTPLFIEAVVKCIKKHPWLNASVDDDKLIVRKDINIGMATALPSGNLIVPVIKEADFLNLTGLTKKINHLANAARNNKLKPDDTQGATFTVTNIGSFGSLMGTPIINQPQVAILAIGAIKKRPVVVETAQGDSIAIRHMMFLSLSYDHRVIDGALGSTFLSAVVNELESFNVNRTV
ncbi:MAG: 2-oxo acid dehydrogenase subunit E2 [Chitinophagaceae bacterium]|nr:2-oxo acid dehydrogenase subunit E2 [Chitinophagaceae bacterium]MCW5928351.1 2-oxo acid dehydrogenase subunit E2 [Chitinophagaceae bacterium]